MIPFTKPKLLIFATLATFIVFFGGMTVLHLFYDDGIVYIDLSEEDNAIGFSIKEIYRNDAEIMTKDSSYYYLPYAQNYNYDPSELNSFIRIGDSIFKPEKSDTLFVIRKEKKYLFVLNKEINKIEKKP